MNLFFISDTHFTHGNILKFKVNDGSMLRNFTSVEEMDERMVDNWNKVVRPEDHVYHLGDVAMKRQHLGIVRRLNGHKRLIFGNHDIFDYKEYALVGFEKLMGMRVMDGLIFTHVPIHEQNLGRFHCNIHGHTHSQIVADRWGKNPDRRWINVCVEKRDYTPVSFEDLKKEIK